ncbi:MAG: hypothetical protein H6617_07400 [Bdellovibrionaceae bacterium]|nr:hypothetical protein [Pseudobdellovibrionaceae bacterium]
MFRQLIFLSAIALLGACASVPPELLLAERPSRAAFLRPANLPGVPVDVMDRDLTREVWSEGFRTVVTPLTVPLIARIAALECRQRQCSSEETRRLIVRLTNAFASNRSCFYLVVSEITGEKQTRHAYALSYHNDGQKALTATRLQKDVRDSSYYRVQKRLLEDYLPTSYRSQVRNTLGFGSSTADIVCGPRIDFSAPFVFNVDPKDQPGAESKRLVWTVLEKE